MVCIKLGRLQHDGNATVLQAVCFIFSLGTCIYHHSDIF